MAGGKQIDWQVGRRQVFSLASATQDNRTIEEMVPSPDGETLAMVVREESGDHLVQLNDLPWETTSEKTWSLRFISPSQVACLVRIDDEWTVAINDQPLEGRYAFAWSPLYSSDGESSLLMVKEGMDFGIVHNGEAWGNHFDAIRDHALSPDGQHAATTVQTQVLKPADLDSFFKGVWTVAVDNQAWDNTFVGAWNPVFDAKSESVAAEVRVSNDQYTIAKNGRAWSQIFGGVWKPLFLSDGSVVAPVRKQGNWWMAKNGEIFWERSYAQLWNQRLSPDGRRLAAVVAPEFGRWTLAIDDQPWKSRWSDLVETPVFSPDGARLATVVKSDNRWSIAVDDQTWNETFDMIYEPLFSPSGHRVATRADRDGRFCAVVDGRIVADGFDKLWDPTFSPDGDSLLLRYVHNGQYVREVIAL